MDIGRQKNKDVADINAGDKSISRSYENDLISRRAAIDAAIEATDSWEGFCSIGQQKLIENYINSLPFAPGMDLISRRAAIDICANVIDLFRGQFGAGVLVAIKESIEELPPAQLGTNLAEVVPVVRCKDCKFREEDAFCTGRGFPCQLVPDDGFCDKGKKE